MYQVQECNTSYGSLIFRLLVVFLSSDSSWFSCITHNNIVIDLDPRNCADVCFHLFLYKHFVFNSKLIYVIIYMKCVYHFLKQNFTVYFFIGLVVSNFHNLLKK